MNKLALSLAAVTLLAAGSASAADLRRPAPVQAVPVAPPVMITNWTGCYVGAGGGYGMFNQETQYINSIGVALGQSNDNGGRGWFGTVQVGCDYQFGSTFVIGAFADYDFSGIKGDMAILAVGLGGEEKLKSSWAAGGRIGWLPFPQLLVFVSGGYTEARFDQINLSGSASGFSIEKHTYTGYFIGSGYEYNIGWLPGLTWKTEYRFADYAKDFVAELDGGLPTGGGIDSRKYVQTIRSELVWRFNFGGPVVARY